MTKFNLLVLILASAIVLPASSANLTLFDYDKPNHICNETNERYQLETRSPQSRMLIKMHKPCSFKLDVPADSRYYTWRYRNSYAQKIMFLVVGGCSAFIKKGDMKEHCSQQQSTHERTGLEASLTIFRSTATSNKLMVLAGIFPPSAIIGKVAGLYATRERNFTVELSELSTSSTSFADPVYYLAITVSPYEDMEDPTTTLTTTPVSSTEDSYVTGSALGEMLVILILSMFIIVVLCMLISCRKNIRRKCAYRTGRTTYDQHEIANNRNTRETIGPVQLISVRQYNTEGSDVSGELRPQEEPSWWTTTPVVDRQASLHPYERREGETNGSFEQLPSYEAATWKPEEPPPSYRSLYSHNQYRQ